MNRELRDFIKEALERGHDREEIRRVLLGAGWQDSEVTNGLSGFADVDFSVAVPRPTPYLYAREAFLYLVSFIALYVTAISFGILVFGLIDYSFPDALDSRDGFSNETGATAIASVVVAFPLYLFLTRWLGKLVAADPERRQSLVRRWLTYLTLVVGAGIILGDLIALLANVLTGDPTLRFALKAISILAITGCIFGYYLWDMRQTEASAASPGSNLYARAALVASVLLVVGCIAYALTLTGSPGSQRDERLDERRVSHLSNLAENIDLYWQRNEELPGNLDDLTGPTFYVDSFRDPETGLRYGYRALESPRYELCAVFATDTADSAQRDLSSRERAWDHGKGRTCFQLEARAPSAEPRR